MCELYIGLNYIEAACPSAPGSLLAAQPAARRDVHVSLFLPKVIFSLRSRLGL